MDCGYFEKLIYRLPDGDLSDAELAALTEHIDGCDACRALYEAMTAAHEVITDEQPVPEHFSANVMDAVREAEKARKANDERIRRNAKIRQRWRFGDLGIVAACLALVVVTVNVLFGDLGRRETADTAETAAAPMMMEEAVEEAAPEAAEADYGMAEATAMDGTTGTGAADTAAMARDSAGNGAETAIYAADGSYLGTIAPDTLAALLSDGGDTAQTDAAPDWTLQYAGTDYDLFVLNDSIYWRESGGDTLTLSPIGASEWTAALE